MANYYGRTNVVGVLCDEMTLPNATAKDSTNMVDISGNTAGKLRLAIFANTAISIATGQALSIELEGYSADTAASATGFATTANNACAPRATGTLETDCHHYIWHKTSADGQLDWSAGSCIWDAPLPETMLAAAGYDHVQLKITTDADESSEKIDAFIYATA